ncbi:4-oxalocrotonate tautomerase family protein [bacterium]|nr:4-oxalocrotonate tautomerase family protein [bacterium]
MPVVTINIAKGRNIETKRKLVRAVTDAVVSTLDVKQEWVTVFIEELDRQSWASGGKLHADIFGEGCGMQGVGEVKDK